MQPRRTAASSTPSRGTPSTGVFSRLSSFSHFSIESLILSQFSQFSRFRSALPEWSDGKAPYKWEVVNDPPWADYPCACKNDTHACESAQTCLWFSVGCTIGCKECDGGSKGGSNPNKMVRPLLIFLTRFFPSHMSHVSQDRCGSGKKATNNDPAFRTINRQAEAFSADDWTRFNPWRAPGSAPVFDACGRAGGAEGRGRERA